MNILFTGASSFSGYWFVKELVSRGHTVTAIIRSNLNDYRGARLERIKQLISIRECRTVFNCTFGSEEFLALIDESPEWDVLCHHAADVSDYKNPTFNPIKALANNTRALRTVLKKIKQKGCHRVVLTGTVFEGGPCCNAVSPYGLSKELTSKYFQYETNNLGMQLGKCVIPNPFGPFEEDRFTTSLIKSWMQEQIASVIYPDYVRDNIHASLLAKAYGQYIEQPQSSQFDVFSPSGYIENQGAFTERFAKEMRSRLKLSCEFELKNQTEFPEPKVRVNTDQLNYEELQWNEKQAWDELANYYKEAFKELCPA